MLSQGFLAGTVLSLVLQKAPTQQLVFKNGAAAPGLPTGSTNALITGSTSTPRFEEHVCMCVCVCLPVPACGSVCLCLYASVCWGLMVRLT